MPASPGNDAPLISERAASRGRIATEGGDEHAGEKRALSRPRRDERGMCFVRKYGIHTVSLAVAEPRAAWGWTSVSPAPNDAPLIDERAATRRSIAAEDGDEHAGGKTA
jgi:hypothetical protein